MYKADSPTNGNFHKTGDIGNSDISLRFSFTASASTSLHCIDSRRCLVLRESFRWQLVNFWVSLFSSIQRWSRYLILFPRSTEKRSSHTRISPTYNPKSIWKTRFLPCFFRHSKPVIATWTRRSIADSTHSYEVMIVLQLEILKNLIYIYVFQNHFHKSSCSTHLKHRRAE